MDFVKSYFEKMRLWPVEHFWLTFFPDQHWLEKSEPKVFNWSEVHFYQSNFLQNPYFSSLVSQRFLIAIIISVTSMSLNHFTLSTCKYTLQYLLLYAPTVNSYQYQLRSNLTYMYTFFSFRNLQIHTRCFNNTHLYTFERETKFWEKFW